MVRVGDVWDSTTDVLAGRARPLAAIAILAFVLPSVLQGALRTFGGSSTGVALVGALIGLGALIVTIWGQLAIIAVASDPATTRGEAGREALARLPAALLVALVLAAAGVLLAVPIAVALAASGYDFVAASAAGPDAMPPIPPGAARFVFWYSLLLAVGFVWIAARLFLTNAVILTERRGIGALGRSWALTRGLMLKLVGVLVLFAVVLFVVERAVQPVIGLAFRLLLGPDQADVAAFLASVAGAIVFAAFLVVTQVFGARLHAATMSA